MYDYYSYGTATSVVEEADAGAFSCGAAEEEKDMASCSQSSSTSELPDEEAGELSSSSGDSVPEVHIDRARGCSAERSTDAPTGRFEVPDVENGWEMGFDLDEDDSSKHLNADQQEQQQQHFFDRESKHEQQEQQEEQDDSLIMPPLVEKSACFESSPSVVASQRRREVYKMPTQKQESDSNFLLWPVGLVINLICFQFKMIGYTISIGMLLLNICYSMVTEPIHRTVEAKNRVTGTISYGLSMITHARLILWEAVSEIFPMLNRAVKKMGYGLLAAAYIFVVMNSLVVPAVLIDLILVSRLVEEPVQIREDVHFDYTEPRPSARVPLFPQVITGSSMKPWAIPKSHRFHITATLSLPESEHNIRLGMFQVTAEILSVEGLVLARFTHPCMLRYQSHPIRYAKTAMLAVPLILGIEVESQILVLKLVESYEDKGGNSYAGSARIMLEPRAGFAPGAGLPEIYSAHVLVQSELPPLKLILYKWKWTCYVWGAMLIFVLEVTAMACCCRQLLVITPPSPSTRATHEWNGDGGYAGSRYVEYQPVIRRPARRKRVSFQDDLPRARAAAAGIGTRPSDIDSFVQEELEALSGTKEKLSFVQEGATSSSGSSSTVSK